MLTSYSFRIFEPTAGLLRLFVVAVGLAVAAFTLYRAPLWLETWSAGALAGAIGASIAALLATVAVAVQGSVRTVRRVAMEIVCCGCALVAAEGLLLVLAPETWSSNAVVQRMTARERAAHDQRIAFDARLRYEVVSELRARGEDAVPGVSQDIEASPAMKAAIAARGLLPLSNVSNAVVVECNEGNGYLQYRTGQHGFNNPAGLAHGPVDVAVIGESFALGHCVAPNASAVHEIRESFPRTANFGIPGSRVLSQLAVFREYVAPLAPRVVVWFVNVNFAEARHESSQPLLVKYLEDPSFSQDLRHRQAEVDAFLREAVVPLNRQRDMTARQELDAGAAFPWHRLVKLAGVRDLADFEAVSREPPPPDMSHFRRAIGAVADTVHGWGGRLVVVVLPSYALSIGRDQDVERYRAVMASLDASAVDIVDGVAVFAQQPDVPGLYTLRMDNHPSERGHAAIGEAVVAAIKGRIDLEH